MNEFTLRARWIIPVASPPLENAWITVAQNRIQAIGTGHPSQPVVDLGHVAILPALVNAHTHLEFSRLPEPLGTPGPGFSAWLEAVVTWRRSKPQDIWVEEKPLAIATGLEESARAGVGLLGEIASPPWNPTWYARAPLAVTVFHELLGRAPERAGEVWQIFEEHIALAKQDNPSEHIAWGLSPHAPYTWSVIETARAANQAAQRQAPIAMHLAESAEEDRWLRTGTGPMADLLARVAPNSVAEREHPRVMYRDYLQALSAAPQVAIIHGNYLEPTDFDWLADHQDQFTLVHCPRTHARFAHDRSPLDAILERNLPLALGTDSRGSNPDLSIWNEARVLAASRPEVPGDRWLRSITLDAAKALGRVHRFGSLQPGMPFHPCVIPLPETAPPEPSIDYLLHTDDLSPLPWSSQQSHTYFLP